MSVFIFLRKYGIIILFAAAAVFFCLLYRLDASAASAQQESHARVSVVLDAGHGGMDGGATGRSGSIEKDINLSIALKASSMLRFFGVNTVLTRCEDISLHTTQDAPVRRQKAEDLAARVAIVSSQENAVYIGIHQNYYDDLVSRGAQVFYTERNAASKSLAEALQGTMLSVLNTENHRKASLIPNKNYIMQSLDVPAVLIECGFLSQPEEELLLRSPQYQSLCAFAIAVGTMSVLPNIQ